MDIAVIGAGSLGLLISGHLARHHKVTLYVRRTEQLDNLKKKGVLLNHADNKESIMVDVSLSDTLREHDLYFVTVKQPHLHTILPVLKAIHHKKGIVFLQNGMGHIELFKHLPQSIFVGTVEHGAHRTSDYEVNHLGVGSIKLASFSRGHWDLTNIIGELSIPAFPFEIENSWEEMLKHKLQINAVINPLTALFNVPNGAIITNRFIGRIARKLSDETAAVLQFEPSEAWQKVKRVAENTSRNTSSMRSDILNGQKTEIEAISGYILKQTKEERIPYTSFVYHAILSLEERGSNQ